MLFQKEIVRRETKFADALSERIKTDPDFPKRIDPRLVNLQAPWQLEEGQQLTAWNAIAAEITDSSLAPELLLHFTEHEDEIQRLATLGPRELTRAMAKLEAKLEAATAGTPAPVIPSYEPSAAQPVTPVTGAATTADGPPDVENSSFEEWFKHHNAQEKKRRRA